MVYTERNDRLIALEVNDLASESPKPTSVATAGPAEVKVADPIIGDPRYLIGDGKVRPAPRADRSMSALGIFAAVVRSIPETGSWAITGTPQER